MPQTNPQTFMRRFYLWWEAVDALRKWQRLPPLGYEVARRWFEAECEPEDMPGIKVLARTLKDGANQKSPLAAQPPVTNQLSRGQE